MKEFQRVVREWYDVNVKPQINEARAYNYFNQIALGVLALAVVGGGFWGYRYYKAQKESSAQVAFADVLQIYHEAMQGKTDVWPQVEMQSSLLYEKYKGSSVGPFFMLVKSDALAQQGRLSEAIAAIDTVIEQLPKNFPTMPIYKTKRALMKIDMTDAAMQTAGLNELRALAQDKENQHYDYAQYYLGLYYWSRNELDQACTIWKSLVESQASEKIAMSPWASLARTKLEQRGQLPEVKPIVAPNEQS